MEFQAYHSSGLNHCLYLYYFGGSLFIVMAWYTPKPLVSSQRPTEGFSALLIGLNSETASSKPSQPHAQAGMSQKTTVTGTRAVAAPQRCARSFVVGVAGLQGACVV